MVKRSVLCLLMMLSSFWVTNLMAQPLEQRLSGISNCMTLETKVLGLIPEYYDQRDLDSIELMLDFVAFKCTESASLRLVRMLLLMEQNRFSDTILTALDLYYIKKEVKYLQQGQLFDAEQFLRYERQMHLQSLAISETWNREVNEQRLVAIINQWVEKLYARPEQPPIERSILRELVPEQKRTEGVSLWHLNTRKHGYLTLNQVYRQYHRNYVLHNAWFFHAGVGFWQPFGPLKDRMGTRLAVTAGGGTVIGKSGNAISLSLTGTFGSLPQPFRVTTSDTSFLSNYPYLWLGHIDFHQKIWQPGRHWYVHALGGLSLVEKGIYKSRSEDPDIENDPGEIINRKMGKANRSVLGLSLGAECSWFVGQRAAFNLQTRYLIQNIGTIGGTRFEGNALQLTLGFRVYWGNGTRLSLNEVFESGGW